MVMWPRIAVALAVLSLSVVQAPADSLGAGGFGPPVLDGVRPAAADPATPAGLAAYVFAGRRDWPAIRLFARMPLDWSRAGSLALPVQNPGPAAVQILLRLDDDPGADGGDRSLTGITEIPPHTTATVVLSLEGAPIGMRARPPAGLDERPGDLAMRDVRGAVDLRHIVALHISGVRTDADQNLAIGAPELRARPPGQTAGGAIVDRFGQSVSGAWPEKIANETELRARLAEARSGTERLARQAYRTADPYGGVDPGTRLDATGYYRTQKIGGRWSLVTPAGHRFFSLGVDAVLARNPTIVTGRETLFAGLPDPGGPLARLYATTPQGARTFDVGQANLERGLGTGWRNLWDRQVVERLRAWGFNTVGNWSEAAVADGGPLASVSFYDFEGASATIPMAEGRTLPDPFDPRFAAVADAVAQTMTASRRDDPHLLGYFSGNEMPWGTPGKPQQGIAAHVLALGPNSDAKRAMVDGLRARYGSAAAFSAAWRLPALADWAEVSSRPVPWPAELTPAARRDVAEFEGRFAELYFRTVAQAIRRHDPHHLYLGTRFAAATPEVVRACARWCDVLSFNVYGRSPEDAAAAWHGLDRPVLIGEFHFGSTDRGSFWPGMVDVGREAARGPAYAAYVAAAVQDPDVVGCHWYQYADEPLTGRPYDGENGHIGLVAVTDIPYADFVSAVADANRKALETFAKQARTELRGTR